MKLLAVDTATEQCSVAIISEAAIWSRAVPTTRGHAELILPMIEELLNESKLSLKELDGLAFGRGPGSFTGVRIAVSVIQGLAFARNLPVVGVSNLAAVAQQIALKNKLPEEARILVCMDARMQEVYWAQYKVGANGLVTLAGEERVSAPNQVVAESGTLTVGVGTGWRAYPELLYKYSSLRIDDTLLPRALEIGGLAVPEFQAGRVVKAADAQPVYLRDQVVTVVRESM